VESLQAAVRALRELGPAPATPVSSTPRQPKPTVRFDPMRYVLRPLAYAAILLIGIGIGWFVKPAPESIGPKVVAEPPAQADPIETRLKSDRFVRNAIALSTAFSQQPRSKRGDPNGLGTPGNDESSLPM
jgi:hypothetical protein